LIDQSRENKQLVYGDWLVTRDRPGHTAHRGLLMGLITPPRLKKNEEAMWRLADRQIDAFIGQGRVEIIEAFSRPYTVMVVADLLGVPQEDFKAFINNYAPLPGQISLEGEASVNPLGFLLDIFKNYIEDRRANPRKDYLTDLAHAKFPDGTLPTVAEAVDMAVFLFTAGQDTSARLITAALRFLGENPDLQRRLRNERQLIPNFLEEVLRMEPPVKCSFRVARVRAKVGDVEVTPGTTVALLVGGMNRDPRKFEQPDQLIPDRKNAREQMAFSRGIHACAGAPLARNEGLISLERIFDRTADFRVSDAKHGPAGARRYSYDPTYLLRSLQELHLEITPQPNARSRAA
jgi:cytochrome P450